MNPVRIRSLNRHGPRSDGHFVLYWMTAFRRSSWNHSLDRAVALAVELDKPLVVLEALRVGYAWASDRFHRFVLDGMADNEKAFSQTPVCYYPYVEPHPGAGSGLLESLAERSAMVVTDDFPAFFLPRMARSAAAKLETMGVGIEAVDGNGLYPMRATERVFTRAFDWRRYLQKNLPDHFEDRPRVYPLRGTKLTPATVPAAVQKKWPRASEDLLQGDRSALAELPIDHGVAAVAERGGSVGGRKRLSVFVDDSLAGYAEKRNDPDADGSSGLSAHLHFGHLSAHEIFWRIANAQGWSPGELSASTSGSRTGWWGMGEGAEGFLDQLVTWREIGFNMCAHRSDYAQYDSLPDWAKQTLAIHGPDERPYLYSLEAFEAAETHDPIWNAAQRQLVREGRVQNYLRMLWGKKILHWTRTPEQALEIMIELNNKYALDGRDPNSYSGIFWTLGRYDRAWGPEREVFGKIRYMSSDNTKRKLKLKNYLDNYGETSAGPLFDAVRDP